MLQTTKRTVVLSVQEAGARESGLSGGEGNGGGGGSAGRPCSTEKWVGPSGKGGRQRKRERDKRRKEGSRAEELGSTDAGGKQMLVKVVGEINGVCGRFLVDSGATTEFIDAEFAKKAGLVSRG